MLHEEVMILCITRDRTAEIPAQRQSPLLLRHQFEVNPQFRMGIGRRMLAVSASKW